MEIEVDQLIRRHSEEGYNDVGVVVWIESQEDAVRRQTERRFWYVETPSKVTYKNKKMQAKSERGNGFYKQPKIGSLKELDRQIREGLVTLLTQTRPSHFFYSTVEDFSMDTSKELLSHRSRRDLKEWLDRRDRRLADLKEVRKGQDLRDLLEEDRITRCIESATRHIECPVERRNRIRELHQWWRRWLFFGKADNSLLPNWEPCGKPGSKKFASKQTGRRNRAGQSSFIMTETDLKKCQAGWRRAKKAKMTDEQAAGAVWQQYYAKSITWRSPTDAVVDLVPANDRPTEAQIKRAGLSADGQASSSRVRMGENLWMRQHRSLVANNGGRTIVLGQLGVLDATSEDQRPVSEASRLNYLPSSWRTMVVDARFGYIYGLYRGFEKGGTIPGLMALLHAASPKDDWFPRYMERPLEPGEWHHIMFKRVLGDAGDLKSESAITSLTLSEVSAEFTRSYAAEHKLVEPKHKTIHRRADHLLEGSTLGQMQNRGDDDQGEQCVKFSEGWPAVINAILFHNNVELVPHLLTLEMRSHFEDNKLAATRKNIVEFCMQFGYVTSEPANLEVLQAQCLPKLAAKLQRNGLHVFDPREPMGKRYIPGLIYDSDWLNASGLKKSKGKECEVQIDPSQVGCVLLKTDSGLQRLTLRTPDDEQRSLSLADWLVITDSDVLKAFIHRDVEQSAAASSNASIEALNKVAITEKAAEASASGARTAKKQAAGKKRANLMKEQERLTKDRLGVGSLAPRSASTNATSIDDWLLGLLDEDSAQQVDEDERASA